MQAGCKADKVDLFLLNKVYLKKEDVAQIVVFLDVLIGFFLYFGFQHLRAMQLLTNAEINSSVVLAQDFSVQLWKLPSHDSTKALKAEMWNWMENVLKKEGSTAVVPQS
jgi:hypothetical protein